MLIADLDHFKSVNDVYGHLAGDAVLREVTRRMQTDIRPYDAVGRYGGEEFLFLLPGCDANETRNKAERLRKVISQAPVSTPAGDAEGHDEYWRSGHGGLAAETLQIKCCKWPIWLCTVRKRKGGIAPSSRELRSTTRRITPRWSFPRTGRKSPDQI